MYGRELIRRHHKAFAGSENPCPAFGKTKEKQMSRKNSKKYIRDYTYAVSFRVPYMRAATILLAVLSMVLFVRMFFCLTSFGLVLIAASCICLFLSAKNIHAVNETIRKLSREKRQISEIREKTAREICSGWKEGRYGYYTVSLKNSVSLLRKSALNPEEKKMWRQKYGWKSSQRICGFALLFALCFLIAGTVVSLLHILLIYLAFGIW